MITKSERDFLIQSNLIEGVGEEGLPDSIKAWGYAKGLECVTREIILEIHRLLAQTLNPRIAGKFRDCSVRVGGRRCCDPYFIEGEIEKILRVMNHKPRLSDTDDILDKEEWTKATHIDFEILHPFEDFNGRTGRILMNWERLKLGLPILIIKYKERFEYYKWFE